MLWMEISCQMGNMVRYNVLKGLRWYKGWGEGGGGGIGIKESMVLPPNSLMGKTK